MSYFFPPGPITKLFLAHINEAHKVLTIPQGGSDQMVRLFARSTGRAFDNSSFDQYWAKLMRDVDTLGQAYFRPSDSRTQYIEYVTGATGLAPEFWDGIANIMGNSKQQWFASYAPSRKRRQAQDAVGAHTEARRRLIGE